MRMCTGSSGCWVLTWVSAVAQHAGGAAAAGQEGQGGRHEPVHDAALPRAQLPSTACGKGHTEHLRTHQQNIRDPRQTQGSDEGNNNREKTPQRCPSWWPKRSGIGTDATATRSVEHNGHRISRLPRHTCEFLWCYLTLRGYDDSNYVRQEYMGKTVM